jgi:hypothetical protein
VPKPPMSTVAPSWIPDNASATEAAILWIMLVCPS